MSDQENPNLHTGDCILTFSGHHLNVFDPNPDHIDIRDIAHALSHVPRFAGHLDKVISVAEHSIAVSELCRPEVDCRFIGLLHDASEAYLMDIPKPIKRHLPDYQQLEDKLMTAIAAKFGFEYPFPKAVKDADQLQLEYEHNELRIKKGIHYHPMTPSEAEASFMNLFHLLENKRKEASNA